MFGGLEGWQKIVIKCYLVITIDWVCQSSN